MECWASLAASTPSNGDTVLAAAREVRFLAGAGAGGGNALGSLLAALGFFVPAAAAGAGLALAGVAVATGAGAAATLRERARLAGASETAVGAGFLLTVRLSEGKVGEAALRHGGARRRVCNRRDYPWLPAVLGAEYRLRRPRGRSATLAERFFGVERAFSLVCLCWPPAAREGGVKSVSIVRVKF